MLFKNKKRKLRKIFEQQKKNEVDLDKKESNEIPTISDHAIVKVPKIIYDSGWIIASPRTNPSESVDIISPKITAKKDVLLPISIFYALSDIVEIPEDLLPFVDLSIQIQPPPNTTMTLSATNPQISYDLRKYRHITGDGNLIYKGYNPGNATSVRVQEHLDRGDFLLENTSKWFKGTIEWTRGGDNWVIETGRIKSIWAYHEVVESVVTPGVHDWKLFSCDTFDDLVSKNITGFGDNFVSEIVSTGGGSQQNLSNELCVDETLLLFDDITEIVITGFATKNGESQGFADWTINTGAGTRLDGDGSIGAGSSFLHAGSSIVTKFDFAWENEYKLYYSSNRNKAFVFNTSLDRLTNTPTSTDCSTDTRPYTSMRVQVNEDFYPVPVIKIFQNPNFIELSTYEENEAKDDGDPTKETITPNLQVSISNEHLLWHKINPDETDPINFRFEINGVLTAFSPATVSQDFQVPFVDEIYSQSATSYNRDEENREDKTVQRYTAEINQAKIRFQLILDHPMTYYNIKSLEEGS